MLQNPLQLRLEKLESWQLTTLMAALVERMYPNYALFCQQTDFAQPQQFRNILDCVWEILLVKNAQVDFDGQLEKLEPLIPDDNVSDLYLVYPAIDACIALSTLLHALLDKDELLEATLKISQQSITSIAQLELAQNGVAVTNDNQKQVESICDEWNLQWELFRALRECEKHDAELIRDIKNQLRQQGISNLGLSL